MPDGCRAVDGHRHTSNGNHDSRRRARVKSGNAVSKKTGKVTGRAGLAGLPETGRQTARRQTPVQAPDLPTAKSPKCQLTAVNWLTSSRQTKRWQVSCSPQSSEFSCRSVIRFGQCQTLYERFHDFSLVFDVSLLRQLKIMYHAILVIRRTYGRRGTNRLPANSRDRQKDRSGCFDQLLFDFVSIVQNVCVTFLIKRDATST